MGDDLEPTEVPDEDADRTVLVDRAKHAAPEEVDEGTLVVDRRPRRTRKPAAAAIVAPDEDEDEDEERTVVVERIERDGDDEDRTAVVDRPGPENDKTVAVERARRGKRLPRASEPDPESVLTVLPSRRGIKTAPVEPGFGRGAVDAVGANVVETYVPREIAPPPAAGPAVPRGDDALRAEAPSMPSVTRRSRKAGVIALLVFAGACVVSVIGVVAVIVWFVRS